METVISKLRSTYKDLGAKKNEDDVRLHVIINTFMGYCGYDVKKCRLEH